MYFKSALITSDDEGIRDALRMFRTDTRLRFLTCEHNIIVGFILMFEFLVSHFGLTSDAYQSLFSKWFVSQLDCPSPTRSLTVLQ